MSDIFDKPEVTMLPQWVCVRFEKRDGKITKVPYCVRTGARASVTDPTTWCTYQTAATVADQYDGIGFVFTERDPFVVIDLDEPETHEQKMRHMAIMNAFKDTYQEASVSGTGVHIIMRASYKGGIRLRRDQVEVYGAKRFMVMTGDVLNGGKDIVDMSDTLEVLLSEMTSGRSVHNGGIYTEAVVDPDLLPDMPDIWDRAHNAENGQLFDALWAGQWRELGYPSQSEADMALINMLCFYTPSDAQVRDLFRMSGLGKRDKAQRNDYLNRSISRYRLEHRPVEINLSHFWDTPIGENDVEKNAEGVQGVSGEAGRSSGDAGVCASGCTDRPALLVPVKDGLLSRGHHEVCHHPDGRGGNLHSADDGGALRRHAENDDEGQRAEAEMVREAQVEPGQELLAPLPERAVDNATDGVVDNALRVGQQCVPARDLRHDDHRTEVAGEEEAVRSEGGPELASGTALFPPNGLLRELADHILKVSVRPMPEAALVAAIGLVAGIAGRRYKVNGTGLNQYILLVAGTGTGKEGVRAGIDACISAVEDEVPSITRFLGPSNFASGQALSKRIVSRPCCVSVLGEFGIRLSQMTSRNANGAEAELKRVLLDLYSKSGSKTTFRPTAYSDTMKNNADPVKSPSLTIVGESTPDTFYGALTDDLVKDGLVPRLLVVDYKGGRPPLNVNTEHDLPESTAALLSGLAVQCMKGVTEPDSEEDKKKAEDAVNLLGALSVQEDEFQPVKMPSDVRKAYLRFEGYCDKKMEEQETTISADLWNRCGLKALRLAGLSAVSRNYIDPVVRMEDIEWAIRLVTTTTLGLEEKFRSGDTQSEENVRTDELVAKYLETWKNADFTYKKTYVATLPPTVANNSLLVPKAYLKARLKSIRIVRNATQPKSEMEYIIKSAVEAGLLSALNAAETSLLGWKGCLYKINE